MRAARRISASASRPGVARRPRGPEPAPAPDDAGVVHARTYDADERRYGADVSVGIDGVQLGGAVSRTREDTHLVAATTRGLDGVWRVRGDCLGRV